MDASRSPIVGTGLAGGLLLFLHGLLPFSHAYPFLWPLAAGAVALFLLARSGARPDLGRTLLAGLEVGAVAAAVAAPSFVLASLFLATSAGAPLRRLLGGEGPATVSAVTLAALVGVAVLAVPAGALGSLLARPFAHFLAPSE